MVIKKLKRTIKKHPQLLKSDIAVMESIAKKKLFVEQKMQRFVAVTGIMLLIVLNIMGSLLLIPFLLFFDGFAQYAIIGVFAICFGFMFNLMIHSIEQLGDKHHIIAGIVVPVFVLLDIVILFTLLEKITKVFNIIHVYNYTFIVILFVVAFIIPYLFDVLRGKHRFR
ncbi:MAG: hypothetical protein WC254_03310 [Candidatus Woesearchaeota archaeon]|jgi:hypothetical protein